MRLLGQPLFRLLAINLALGTATAVLMLGGLLALNPHGLRDLIFSDRSPGANDARNGGGREARAFSVRRPQRSTDDLRQRAPVVHHA
jgi:hypothetical protein